MTRTILLTWNPDRWPWPTYDDDIQHSRREHVAMSWSVATKGISQGDRAFLLRQGRDRGIVASGLIQSAPYPDKHWDGTGKITEYCDVEFEVILHPDDRLRIEALRDKLPAVAWAPRQSGTSVHAPADDGLEELWRAHLARVRPTSSRSKGA